MKLVSINIENNLHNEAVLEFLKKEQPDVVCLQEFLEEDFEIYKKELDFGGVYQTLSYIMDHKNYPHLLEKKEGLVIFAKNIVGSGSIFYLGEEERVLKPFHVYAPGTDYQENRALKWVDVKNKDNETFRFVTTHFPLTEKGESTPYQLEVLDLMLEQLDKLGDFVLCGDLNAPRGNETFNRLAKKYKDNIPLEYKTSIDQNLHRVKGIQLMVDGLFTTPVYQTSNVKLVDGVSDHMAIVAEIHKN